MNPGVVEETGKTAREVVSGLSRSPLMLAVVFMNALVLGGIFWLVHGASERMDRRFATVLQFCTQGR